MSEKDVVKPTQAPQASGQDGSAQDSGDGGGGTPEPGPANPPVTVGPLGPDASGDVPIAVVEHDASPQGTEGAPITEIRATVPPGETKAAVQGDAGDAGDGGREKKGE